MFRTRLAAILSVVLATPFFASAAAWSGPPGAPPGGNVDAPINVGSTFQDKVGGAWFDGGVGVDGGSSGKMCVGFWCITSWADLGTSTASQWQNGASGAIYYNGGNVGVGTAIPARKLHVAASGVSSGILLEDNSPSAVAPYIEVRGQRSDSNAKANFGGQLVLTKSRTDAAIQSGNQLGRVVFGGNHTDGLVANIGYAAAMYGIADGPFNSATDMPTALAFFTGSTSNSPSTSNVDIGTERMRISSLGNVGIGTASPGAKLHVNGGVSLFENNGANVNVANFRGGPSDLDYEWVGFYSGATREGIILWDGDWTGCANVTDEFCIKAENGNHLSLYSAGGAGDHIRLMPGSGNVGIGTTLPTAKLDVAGRVQANDTIGNLVVGSQGAQMELGDTTVGTLRFDANSYRIYAGGTGGVGTAMTLLESGNVGIGNTAPTYKLDVAGNVNVSTGYCFSVAGTCITSGGSQWTTSGTNIYNSNTGNVGIGNTAPVRRLDVDSAIDTAPVRLTTNTTITNNTVRGAEIFAKTTGTIADGLTPILRFYVSDPGTDSGLGGIGFARAGGNTTGDFVVRTDAAGTDSEKFRITSAGNVGIGNTAPLNKLAVQTNDNTFAKAVLINNTNTGTDAQAALQLTQGANTSYLFQGGVSTYLWNAANGPIAFFTNSLERMRIDSTGNVGIGNTAPAYKLDVTGQVRASTGIFFDTTANPYLYSDSGTNNAVIRTNTSAAWRYFIFGADGSLKANSFVYNSDRRLKKDIQPIQNALSKVLQLEGVGFTWTSGSESGRHDIGFIAQDVEQVVPEVVTTDASTTLKAIDYARLTPVIVNAIKELNEKIDAQQKEIDELKAQIQTIVGN